MKKILLLLAMTIATPLFAQFNPYIEANVGYETSRQNYGIYITRDPEEIEKRELFFADGIAYGVAVGADFTERFRAEIAYTYKDLERKHGELTFNNTKQQTIMANIYVYPFKRMLISPYLGIGGGWGFSNISPAYSTDTKAEGIAYALYFGADYKISNHIALDLQGNANSIVAPYGSDTHKIYNIINFGAKIGLRYSF